MDVETLKSTISDEMKKSPAYNQLINLIKSGSSISPPLPNLGVTKMKKASLYLRVRLGQGSAFVGQLAKARSSSALEEFVVHISFKNSRLVSAPVPCCVEPDFSNTFLFELDPVAPLDQSTWLRLVSSDESKLNLVVIRQPVTNSSTHQSFAQTAKELVASASIDWRTSLLQDGPTSVELSASGPEAILHGVSGCVTLGMELVQAKPDLILPCTTDDIRRFISSVEEKESENSRDFYLYARDWWKSYQEISSLHASRNGVKIFAEDETGTHRSVCTFVEGVRTGRLIDSPRHAARFVALIPFERRAGVGGRRIESWQSWHAFLARGRGDVEDHATLLCSLLLGFGLSAYVVIGTAYDDSNATADSRRDHAWVCTRASNGDVVFIESLTGQRYEFRSGGKNKNLDELPYATVSCVFNDVGFWANKQVDDDVIETDFNFDNHVCWKSMDPEAIRVAPRPVKQCVTLLPPTISAQVCGEELEAELRQLIVTKRNDGYGKSAIWDDGLGYLLQPALSAYEMERLTGYSFGNDDFQSSVKNAVPDKHCFKGFPTCFSHRDANKIMTALEANNTGGDILATEGDSVKFALRVKIYCYPENVCAVWVMLAVRYCPRN